MEQPQEMSLPQLAGAVLDDLRYYLAVIDPVTYQTPQEILSGSTIGQHTRHILEFFHCLLEQSASAENVVINYALRKRDHRIETQPDYALQILHDVSEQVKSLQSDVICFLDCTEHGQLSMQVKSTIGRELVYNIEHAIHHLAIVKIALRTVASEIMLPAHFGVAPSTIRHRQEACAQ